MRLIGDSTYYTVPGQLPASHSLGFIHKAGGGRQSNTLFVVRCQGDKAIALEEIWGQAFQKSDHLMSNHLVPGKPTVVLPGQW